MLKPLYLWYAWTVQTIIIQIQDCNLTEVRVTVQCLTTGISEWSSKFRITTTAIYLKVFWTWTRMSESQVDPISGYKFYSGRSMNGTPNTNRKSMSSGRYLKVGTRGTLATSMRRMGLCNLVYMQPLTYNYSETQVNRITYFNHMDF